MTTARVTTPLPGPKSKALLERWTQVEADSTGFQAPVVWQTGRGCTVTDVDGNVFLDWTSGVLVTNVGHCHPRLVETIRSAAGELLNNYECASPSRIRAAERLVKALPPHLEQCFFLSTGSEATEAAIRLMKRKTGRHEILGFHGGFHGRTYAAASVGGLGGPKKQYGPVMPGVLRAPFPYPYRCAFGSKTEEECAARHLDYLDHLVQCNSTGDLAGLIVEPYQGAAGFIFPPAGYLKKLEVWARGRGMLFTIDEVQSSYGRTGTMWAHTQEGLTPDLMCIGKGIGSGVPVSALAARREIFACLAKGELSSTWGGNPLASAVAVTVLDIMEEEKLCERSASMGALLLQRLRAMEERFPCVGQARGRGLVAGLELVQDKKTKEPAPGLVKEAILRAASKGLLIGSVGYFGNVIRVAPPLVVTEAEVHESCDIMEATLRELGKA